MKQATYNKSLAGLITLAVAAGIALILIYHPRRTYESDANDQGPVTESSSNADERSNEKQSEREMIAARPGPVLKSPLLREDADEAKKAIRENNWLTKREDGIYTYLPFSNMEDPRTDIAMVELRFYRENGDGELEKLYIEHISAYQRIGQKSEGVYSEWEFGRPVISVEAYALRVGAGPPGTGFRFLGFGRRYHLKYKAIDAESREPVFFDSIIKIPGHIPAGKMAVIEVLAKPELSGGYAIPKRPPEPDTRIPISGKITTSLPPTQTEWMVAYNHADKSVSDYTAIQEDGSFDLGKCEPGGMLRVAERGPQGVAWIIVDSVDKSQWKLPRDADRVIRRNSLRDFEIVMPDEPSIKNAALIWFVDDKEGLGPIAWQTAPSRYDPEKLERFHKTRTRRMKAPPGKYWVKAYYDPPREWVDLGWITVPATDESGNVPQLQPVLD